MFIPMKKIFTLVCVAAISFVAFFATAEAAQAQDQKASLTVNVADEDGAPIADAWLYFLGVDFYTDATGKVTVAGIDAADVSGKKVAYSVYKDGYDFYEGEADFTESLNVEESVKLAAAKASLTIKVFAGEDAVEGAWVYCNGQDYYTNEYGEVKIDDLNAPDVIGKTIPVTVYKDGYEFYEGVADFSETMEAFLIVELEAAKASLTIKVFAGEDAVEGAWVYCNGQDYYTNEYGEVKIDDLNAPDVIGKTIPVTVYKDGYEFYEGVADFSETMEAFLIVELEAAKASLSVKVISGDDVVAGAVVSFNGQEYVSDENGDVKVTDISAPDVIGKTFPVTVTKEGFKTYEGVADFSETMDAYVVAELEPKTSGIDAIVIEMENGDAKTFDLQGRSVANPRKGQIYIVNGKKVLFNR